MNRDWLIRTKTLIGAENIDKLQRATVAILGLGGVGGAAAEAICRMGVGRIILVDSDTVDRSNLNRQLFATADMVGREQVPCRPQAAALDQPGGGAKLSRTVFPAGKRGLSL